MTINKQALHTIAEAAKSAPSWYAVGEFGDVVDPAKPEWKPVHEYCKTFTAERVLALLDELEDADRLIDTLRQDKDKVIDMSFERVNKLLSRAEAAEKRIAELEARVVVLPQRMEPEGYHIDEAYLVAADDGDYFDRDEVIEALRAAGISIKGE